jgi:hypothetical protein
MPWVLDARFRTAANRDVLAFLEREQPSAHSDVASALTESARQLSDVAWYCPDVHRYAYVVLHTREQTIFGLAFGMATLAYRLPARVIQEAAADGGTITPGMGEGWVCFKPWGSSADLRRWCKTAHDHAVAPLAARPEA